MIKTVSAEFVKKDKVDFIIDDDIAFNWLSKLEASKFDRFIIVIDKRVAELWGERILIPLAKHGKQILELQVVAEESTKSLDFYPKLIDFLENHRAGLSDLIFSVGGGIVSDLVSFACSTYMRGLPFIAVPTTLIGQVDAVSAGKTCLNTKNTKNLLGTFYYPFYVYNNIHFLSTNKENISRQGWSEIFKYGLLGSEELIRLVKEYFHEQSRERLMEIIDLAIQVRINIRKKNPLASNLGHTFGHAIEKMSNFDILHGDAISVGTVIAINFAKSKGIISEEDVEKIMRMMKELGLNLYLDKKIDINNMIDLMRRDKKSSSKKLNLVLIRGIGEPHETNSSHFYETSPEEVKSFLISFLKNYPYMVDGCSVILNNDRLHYK